MTFDETSTDDLIRELRAAVTFAQRAPALELRAAAVALAAIGARAAERLDELETDRTMLRQLSIAAVERAESSERRLEKFTFPIVLDGAEIARGIVAEIPPADYARGPRRWRCKQCGNPRRRLECLSCGNVEPLTDEARVSGLTT